MNSVFAALPGVEVPVDRLRDELAHLWDGDADAGGVSEFRASQMNLVLHFGIPTTPEEAVEHFGHALRLAERYPSRLIALVPLANEPAGAPMRARITSQCFLGSSRRERICTEALALAYPEETRGFVADLVSTLVETDLPVYYWAHHFASCRKLAGYRELLRGARRLVFDSALAPADALEFAWPRPEIVRDLAEARLLHARQLVGQYLAGLAPETLGAGLTGVVARHGEKLRAEARALATWAARALGRCGAVPPAWAAEPAPDLGGLELELRFQYSTPRYFRWRADFAPGWAGFDADFGAGRVLHCAPVRLADPVAALGEALFFQARTLDANTGN